jgi:hypothetical protein
MSATKPMKKKKLLISDVLHYAADHCLGIKGSTAPLKNKFSCSAVIDAYFIHNGAVDKEFLLDDVLTGLANMGCDRNSPTLFRKHGDPVFFTETVESVQGMRYMWLKWAALMAEEQGV